MDAMPYKKTKATEFIRKLSLVMFFCGYPNFWVEKLSLPKTVIKLFERITYIINIAIYVLIISEIGAFYTQNQLNEKQKYIGVSQSMIFSFGNIMVYYKKDVRKVFYNLHVTLKRNYNDLKVEEEMIKRSLMYQFALVFTGVMSVLMYTIEAVADVSNNGNFTAVITAYPDINDKSDLANVVRGVSYLVWIFLVSRMIGLYFIVLPIPMGLSHQFKNLKSYFESLNDIFETKDISQRRKEELYEQQFIVGIKLHADTLRCGEKVQAVCSMVFSGQIIFNILLMILLMTQMVNSDRTLINVCSAVLPAIAILISTGFCMWNSGDVTVEASELGTSIYFSGWHNCYGPSSVRIRKLVVVTMANAQKPVELKGLGYINLSYESYLRIVKWSYSVFSVIY